MSKLIIGNQCLENTDHSCFHVVRENENLFMWDIDTIRNNIFNYNHIIFINQEYLNFNTGDDVFGKCNLYPQLRHFISKELKSSKSSVYSFQ